MTAPNCWARPPHTKQPGPVSCWTKNYGAPPGIAQEQRRVADPWEDILVE